MTVSNPHDGISVSNLLPDLLEARKSLGMHKNRRRLFARFDEVFAKCDESISAWVLDIGASNAAPRSSFQFNRIKLQNWKAFEFADFVFPATVSNFPFVLIGGDNGHGKTSILDAIIAGLYGINGLLEAECNLRDIEVNSRGSIHSDHREFLERALHRPAFERGARMSSIMLEVATDHGILEIDRRWYFDEDGRLFEDDEELVLRSGADRDIVLVPTDEDPSTFYQSTISNLLAPASMIPFFLFDGEHVQRLAKRNLSEQVRLGIESAVGVGELKGLVGDLTDYARDRGRHLQADDAEAAIAEELTVVENALVSAREHAKDIENELLPLRKRRDDAVHEMGALSGGTYQDKHAALEFRHGAEAKLTALRSELATSSSRLLPTLLVGRSLVAETIDALEKVLLISGEATGSEKALEKLLDALGRTDPLLDPQMEEIFVDRIKRAWQVTRPDPNADTLSNRHKYLVGHRIDRVIASLTDSETEARLAIPDILGRIDQLKREIANSERVETEAQKAESSREKLVIELKGMNARIEELEALQREADQRVWKLEGQLTPMKEDLLRRQTHRRSRFPASRVIDASAKMAAVITESMEKIVPQYYSLLADRVTIIYRTLAHKGLVDSINIDEAGNVSLYDNKRRNLSETDFSAGESQVFAMSLIAAVSTMLGSPLPLVVDTPLGRLDPGHRERVLEYFANRRAQTILLSQPEEIGGRYYDMIVDKVAAEFRLSYRLEDGGLGSTVLESGYFPREAA